MHLKKSLSHIIPWMMISALMIFAYNAHDESNIKEALLWWSYTSLFYVGIFYGFYQYMIPRWLGKSNFLILACAVLTMGVYPAIKIVLDDFLGPFILHVVKVQLNDSEDHSSPMLVYLSEYFRRMLTPFFLIPIAFLTRFAVDWFKNLKLQTQLEAQNLKSELAMLRNQVNPHFLFNTLNNIDSMVYKVAPEASEAIMKLSGIMRYMLYEANTEKVLLDKEISYIKSFVGLNQLRIQGQQVTFDISGNISEQQIAPMLLIPFVENAFKHGARRNDVFPIQMTLKAEKERVHFSVCNIVSKFEAGHKDEIGGVGLPNVKRRLNLLYPNKHELLIKEENDEFKVDLYLTL